MNLKTVSKETIKFKRGEIYGVDALNDLPIGIFSDYFDNEESYDYDSTDPRYQEHEMGSAKCIKTFEITVIIKTY